MMLQQKKIKLKKFIVVVVKIDRKQFNLSIQIVVNINCK